MRLNNITEIISPVQLINAINKAVKSNLTVLLSVKLNILCND